jgi:putative DNA methylase
MPDGGKTQADGGMPPKASDRRLIETWLPIAALGVERVRERTPMTPFPAPNRLHVWWARRPLVASRAAILASLLPADADQKRFLHALGIHGDPVGSKRRIDAAKRTGTRFEGEAYTYRRAFTYTPQPSELAALRPVGAGPEFVMLDPTAGGGAIPFEAMRLGGTVHANDLNPVAALLLKATVEWPALYGGALIEEFDRVATEFIRHREERLKPFFPPEPNVGAISTNFLWARTVTCPYCAGLLPLSPNWRLAPDGTGVLLKPMLGAGPNGQGRRCEFMIG